ncbi:MAG TPA: RNA polymerase sigma factor [Ktedonobacteraceae bacterium]|jgi:RNA polymerase sigma-70 factor (ECF subfamily)|nr:RNA polymerase sigma factor [Ktedonobacteraceae bacterium]
MEPEYKDLLDALATDLAGNYEQLVMLYWGPLKGFVIRRMIPVQDAEDMVQEIFLRAFLDLQRSSGLKIRTLKLRAWLYTIAWNACANRLSRNKQPVMVSIECEEGLIVDLEGLQSEQPELLLEQKERREELESQIATLPPRYRDVVSLYYFEGFSQQEIADMLEVRVGTVKVNVYRGLKMLQKQLAVQANRVR